MADWALSSCERQEFNIADASRGTANGKGAYAQIIAATSFAYSSVTLNMVGDGGGPQCYLVDLAIGAAAAEQVIIPNILVDSNRGLFHNSITMTVPIAVPTGVRLSACVQEAGGAGTRFVSVAVSGRAGGSNEMASTGVAVNYGANTTTTNGVLVDQGATANTYGAWAEISSATSRDHNGLIAILGTNQSATSLGDGQYRFQIGVGASGSEVAIAEFNSATASADNRLQVNTHDIAACIPSGTRLAMRARSSLATTASRNATAILLGY